jgi:hypothetical protein
MTHQNANTILDALLDELDIPTSYYDKAVARYRSLGEWFAREASRIVAWEPAVSAQGSFRLGTVTKPTTAEEEYDLDLVCRLEKLGKTDVTQRRLKELVGEEVRAYAKSHGVKAPVEERKRAWRLEYADGVRFHIDILACVPEDLRLLAHLVDDCGVEPELAAHAVALTCTSHRSYDVIASDWPTSNPEGYATWFERRMVATANTRRQLLVKEGRYDSIAHVPVYALKTPLQRTVQLLKRHRDTMFRDAPDLKPISMIVTTLAAHAYEGEVDLADALRGVLERIDGAVMSEPPFVANPTNPAEDFADKWNSAPELQQNFDAWVDQARRDFAMLLEAEGPRELMRRADSSLAIPLTEGRAASLFEGVEDDDRQVAAPAIVITDPPKPWARSAG